MSMHSIIEIFFYMPHLEKMLYKSNVILSFGLDSSPKHEWNSKRVYFRLAK
jgi:hypothetical protein